MLEISKEVLEWLENNEKVKDFNSEAYRDKQRNMSLIRCLESIVGERNGKLKKDEEGNIVLEVGDRIFILDNFCCCIASSLGAEISLKNKQLDYEMRYNFPIDDNFIWYCTIEKKSKHFFERDVDKLVGNEDRDNNTKLIKNIERELKKIERRPKRRIKREENRRKKERINNRMEMNENTMHEEYSEGLEVECKSFRDRIECTRSESVDREKTLIDNSTVVINNGENHGKTHNNINSELKEKIKKFNKADYPNVGEHISLVECLRIITKDPNFELDEETGFITVNNRIFEIIDVDCPDLKVPNAFLFEGTAKICLKNGKYVIEYDFEYKANEISRAYIYKESEEGYIEIIDKKYEVMHILDKEKAKNVEGISLDD